MKTSGYGDSGSSGKNNSKGVLEKDELPARRLSSVQAKEVATPETSKHVGRKDPNKEVTADGDGLPARKTLSTKSTESVTLETSKRKVPETSKTAGARNTEKGTSERGDDSSSRKTMSMKPVHIVTPEPSIPVVVFHIGVVCVTFPVVNHSNRGLYSLGIGWQ